MTAAATSATTTPFGTARSRLALRGCLDGRCVPQRTPASVQLLFSVQVADAAEATTVIDKVTQVLPDAAAAASTLGVSVLTAPVSTARDASVPPLLPLAPPPRLPAASPASALPPALPPPKVAPPPSEPPPTLPTLPLLPPPALLSPSPQLPWSSPPPPTPTPRGHHRRHHRRLLLRRHRPSPPPPAPPPPPTPSPPPPARRHPRTATRGLRNGAIAESIRCSASPKGSPPHPPPPTSLLQPALPS